MTVGSHRASLSSDFSHGVWRTFPIAVKPGATVLITVTSDVPSNVRATAALSGVFLGRDFAHGRLGPPDGRAGANPKPASPRAVQAAGTTSTTSTRDDAAGGPRLRTDHRRQRLFSSTSACGLPDPAKGNVGVPPGTALQPSPGLDITKPGTVISKLDIAGNVVIDAPNVTIVDSRVTWSTLTGAAIQVNANNARIMDTTITGQDSGQNSIEHAIYSRSHTTVGERLDMENCAECWTGSGTLRSSYARVNSNRVGEHLEAVYYGGGDASLTIDGNTLLNPSLQTGVIFVSSDFGDVRDVTITHNLLAGGGAVIWGGTGCSTGSCGKVLGPVVVTGNRFARCLGTDVFNKASGGRACGGGPDSHGYFPDGGYLFPVTRMKNAVTTWSDNVWDDDGSTVGDCVTWYSC